MSVDSYLRSSSIFPSVDARLRFWFPDVSGEKRPQTEAPTRGKVSWGQRTLFVKSKKLVSHILSISSLYICRV